jgi:hypothetical protein
MFVWVFFHSNSVLSEVDNGYIDIAIDPDLVVTPLMNDIFFLSRNIIKFIFNRFMKTFTHTIRLG